MKRGKNTTFPYRKVRAYNGNGNGNGNANIVSNKLYSGRHTIAQQIDKDNFGRRMTRLRR